MFATEENVFNHTTALETNALSTLTVDSDSVVLEDHVLITAMLFHAQVHRLATSDNASPHLNSTNVSTSNAHQLNNVLTDIVLINVLELLATMDLSAAVDNVFQLTHALEFIAMLATNVKEANASNNHNVL